ncbi:MAG: histidinol-phosphate transaminase [Acidobacteriota bacterium]
MNKLIPKHILEIHPYVPGKPVEELQRERGIENVIKLASNENPLGPSPKAVEAMRRVLKDSHLYPEDHAYYLQKTLEEKLGFPFDQIIVGAGTTELIKIIAHSFLNFNEKAIMSEKSFLMYKLATQEVCGSKGLIKIPTMKDYSYDLSSFLENVKPGVKLIWIANPNNPTGAMIKKSEMRKFLDQLPDKVIIVIDEAYFEYAIDRDYPDGTEFVKEGRNVIVLRTFSKIYGLAGLRIGYGISRSEIIKNLYRVKAPFNTCRIAQEAALAALEDDEHARRSKENNKKGKEMIYKFLDKLGVEYVRSFTNFVMINLPFSAQILYEKLLDRGVIVRPLDAFDAPDSIRVTVGTEEETKIFLKAFEDVFSELISK